MVFLAYVYMTVKPGQEIAIHQTRYLPYSISYQSRNMYGNLQSVYEPGSEKNEVP